MSDVVRAFLLGVLSAVSLGVGALTAAIWRPTNFVLGLLTAFGAGALLSAVTIDIVADSVDAGHVRWLAIGAVSGGVVFEILNRVINSRGGFLRKASTSITFLRDREVRRRRDILDDLERIDVFDGLPDRELDAIAQAFRAERLDAGETLYRHGDPCDHLNVLAEGEVAMTRPDGVVALRPHQAFGHLAFLTGTRHTSSAVARVDSEVLRLNRGRLRSVLRECPEFAGRVHARIRGEELLRYLRDNHPEITADGVARWRRTIDAEGVEWLLPLVEVAETTPAEQIIGHLADMAPFRGVPRRTLESIAGRMFPEEHDAGYVYFRPGEASERLYVVSDGDIALIDATGESDDSILLHEGEECGALSFFTGMRHTATAIGQSTTDVWVLRRSDLVDLMGADPALRHSVGEFVGGTRIGRYLERDQDLSADETHAFRRKAHAAIRKGRLPPTVAARVVHGAPLAIWLGLLLDAIPESLVIGATADAVRVSFLVGIVLSNYPEALASSVGMRERRLAWRSIGGLWGTVILVTGLGAAIGTIAFQQASPEAFAVVEGLAAGAMLTVITQTMMPEALQRSGGFVGLSALGGFLVTTLIGA